MAATGRPSPAPGFTWLTEEDKAYLRGVAEAAPPLTPEQRARLRPILKGTLRPRETQAA